MPAVVVAPLRLARGIQNKILEAMAMERPVIASAECAAAVDAVKGSELLTGNLKITPPRFNKAIDTQLANPELAMQIGQSRPRQRVIALLQLGSSHEPD
jgi:glycosyltransferase involved in cell wall biosynthesis